VASGPEVVGAVPDVVAPRARNVAIDLLTRHPFTLPAQEAGLDDAFLAVVGSAVHDLRRDKCGHLGSLGFRPQ